MRYIKVLDFGVGYGVPMPSTQRHLAIIEDDNAVLGAVEFVLEAYGYQVDGFGCAKDAIDSPKILEADCLVIDYALPDIDGLAALKLLRERGLSCPAIIIASNPSERCRAAAEKAGAPLIEKPIMGEALVDILQEMLNGPANDTRG